MGSRIVVSGTSTGVGKTWVTAAIARSLREHRVAVAARKPVESFDSEDERDAVVLADATGEPVDAVCAPERSYPVPVAPPMAAEILGLRPFSLDEVLHDVQLPGDGVALIEGVGGPRSPLSDDADTVDLARSVEADAVLLVAEPGLGTINAVLLAADAFAPLPVVVFVNRYDAADALHVRNARWLSEVAGCEVFVDVADVVERILELGRHRQMKEVR